MGWGSKLLNIGSLAALAIPGVGPGASALMKGLSIAGKVAPGIATALGSAAAGRSAGKQTQANQQLTQDEIRQRMYQTLTSNILNQDALRQHGFEQGSQNATNTAGFGRDLAKFQVDAPGQRFGQAIKGNLAANMQDVQAQVPSRYANSVVNFSGGLRPSALGPGGRQTGRTLADLAQAAMGKDTFAMPQYGQAPSPSPLPQQPPLSQLPQSDFLDKLLAGGTAGAGLLAAFGNNGQQPSGPMQGPPAPPIENLPGFDPTNPLGNFPNKWKMYGAQ